MFSAIYSSFVNYSAPSVHSNEVKGKSVDTIRQQVHSALKNLNELESESTENVVTANHEISDDTESESESTENVVSADHEMSDDTESESESTENVVSADHEISVDAKLEKLSINYNSKDSKNIKEFNQLESLHCLFTWKIKQKLNGKEMIQSIENKYGYYNLDLTLPQFTFARFIGNLIISYELFINGETHLSNMKIFEISNWFNKLDKNADEFYLSINTALKHILKANFTYMLVASKETDVIKQVLNEIVPFDSMDNKSKAAVCSIHASILLEYGKSREYFDDAYYHAKIACECDPVTSHWWHIYAHVLITQVSFTSTKRLLFKNDLVPESEIYLAIREAVVSSFDETSIHSVDSLLLTALNLKLAGAFEVASAFTTVNPESVIKKQKKPNLKEELDILVKKNINGENPLPDLKTLASKFTDDKWKIIAQICSYTALYNWDFKSGIEFFILLIEQSKESMKDLIEFHRSLFINTSKTFNLAELIWNEISLIITTTVSHSLEDILFYYKAFLKIKETCGIKTKSMDLLMRPNLMDFISYKSNYDTSVIPKTVYQNVTDSVNDENFGFKNQMFPNETINKTQMLEVNQHANFENLPTHSQSQYNLFTAFQDFVHTYSYQQYQCLPSPSLLECKFNLIFQSIQCEKSSTTYKIPLTDIDISLSKLIKDKTTGKKYRTNLDAILKNYPNSFKIYTDASRYDNSVGIAVVSEKKTFTYKLSPLYSSNQAEAVAILRALDYALVEDFNEYVILSDSLSTITSIQNKNINCDVVNSILCLMHLHQLKGHVMHLIWIPSHKMILGNEIADTLARDIALSKTAVIYSHNSFMKSNF